MNKIFILVLAIVTFCAGCAGEKPGEPTAKVSAKTTNTKPEHKNSTAPKPMAVDAKEAVDKVAAQKDQVAPIPKAHIKKAKEILAAVSDEDVAAVDAKKKYKMLCIACHGFKGNLMVNGAKDLTKSKISLAESVAQVYFGRGNMMPFKGVLKEEEIVAVAQYIQKKFGN